MDFFWVVPRCEQTERPPKGMKPPVRNTRQSGAQSEGFDFGNFMKGDLPGKLAMMLVRTPLC
jgi:hypothetical protein